MTTWIRRLAARTRLWLQPGTGDAEFEQELEAHLALLTEEHERRGMAPADARRAARVALGNPVRIREERRETGGLPLLDAFAQDVRYAVRALGRNPGFAAVAILTLGLGIGANAAIFSVLNAVVLRPLPYAEPSRLIHVFQVKPQEDNRGTGWSYENFVELASRSRAFEGFAGSQHHQLTLTGWGDPFAVDTSVVTPGLFTVFGVRPIAGRVFAEQDGAAGAAPVVILSEGLWRGPFHGDPAILGRAIELDNRPFTVVGIMPASFRFPLVSEEQQLWIPVRQDPLFGPWMTNRRGHWLQVTGRLRDGVTAAQAQADVDAVAAQLAAAYPAENGGWQIRMMPLGQMIFGNLRSPLLVLLAAVLLVLLIACANIANLLLSRATSRAREFAVRAALGGSRGRLVRQLLTETAVLGALGCAAGLALAAVGVRVLAVLVPPTVPRVSEIGIDVRVLAFTAALSIAATVVCGLGPALFGSRVNLERRLRADARSGESRGRRRARKALAALEVALAVVLLAAAGLVLRSFANLTRVDPGFQPQQVLKAEISLPRFEYSTPAGWRGFARDVLDGVRAQPGLAQTAIAIPSPIADGTVNLEFAIVGAPPPGANVSRTANFVAISPGYFRVMGVPLAAGRAFDEHDREDSRRVCVISQRMAQLYFPGENPVGRKLRFGLPPDAGTEREVVGVVGDVRDVALDREPGPMMYVPFAQAPFPGVVLVARTPLDPAAAVSAIRHVVTGIDAHLPVTNIGMMPELLETSLSQQRFRTFLLAVFGMMALVLAAVGIFGVISYSVATRTHEIGVRMALGATRGAILRMVLWETAAVTAAGVALGLPAALAATRVIGHLLFAISPRDPTTLAGVVAGLAGVAALAGLLPARRATRVHPVIALRQD